MQKVLVVVVALATLLVGYGVVAQMDGDHAGPVMNYHRINDRLVTGGHLVGDGLSDLKSQGISVVVDLRDEPPEGEQQRYADQGIKWINVPVVWRNPLVTDFEKFAKIMRVLDDEHVLVQCQANYRASAMTYLYRTLVDGVADNVAVKDMRAIWDPSEYDTWNAFIGKVQQTKSKD